MDYEMTFLELERRIAALENRLAHAEARERHLRAEIHRSRGGYVRGFEHRGHREIGHGGMHRGHGEFGPGFVRRGPEKCLAGNFHRGPGHFGPGFGNRPGMRPCGPAHLRQDHMGFRPGIDGCFGSKGPESGPCAAEHMGHRGPHGHGGEMVRESRKFRALTEYLRSMKGEKVTLEFSEIEDILGKALPEFAVKHRSAWANTETHSFALGWLSAGYITRDVDMEAGKVTFVPGSLRDIKSTVNQKMILAVNDLISELGPDAELTAGEIKRYVSENYDVPITGVIPADYCYNRVSRSSLGKPMLLEYTERETYRLLGAGADYTGDVIHRSRRTGDEMIAGRCENGVRTLSAEFKERMSCHGQRGGHGCGHGAMGPGFGPKGHCCR